MGMRHTSIGLRVGILIAVPLLCLVALYAFAASLTLSNALTQTRATSVRARVVNPITVFQLEVAAERHLALLSLASPTSPEAAGALGMQESATSKSFQQLQAALGAPAVTDNASAGALAAMRTLDSQGTELNLIRSAVADNAIEMQTALADYNSIIQCGYAVADQLLAAQVNVPLVTESIDLINLDRARQAALSEADLLTADMSRRQFPSADRLTIASLSASRQQLVASALPNLRGSYAPVIDRSLTPSISDAMTAAEATVAYTPWHSGAAPASVADANSAFAAYATALISGEARAGAELQQTFQRHGHTVMLQLILAAGLGLLALVISVTMSLLLGRGLVRQLRALRESALTLANQTLPGLVSQLRAGQQVSVDEYAATEFPTRNEIEQVGQAVSVLQHAAVQSAADEARLRRGISDVFRNLAGRSQSLLHRQLALLDAMERRASDPDELENLFRIDHLTTRMRRHAEGLIILSGDTPARGWRRPVPLVDVLRAAVAEVEDYTRIRVLCQTTGVVAGHAVADIVHLLAELAENATVFSPPTTPVRMQGDSVGQGFVIEIEDRGLGISQARLEEINANLANPPQFDLSGSDRLGLFIAGQLARRHDITVTLRPSVYGGTTAIVLLPIALVGDADAIVPDRVLPAGREDQFQFDRLPGRHGALTALPGSNGHRSPTGDSGQGTRSGGFIFGRVTQAGNGTSDGYLDDAADQQPWPAETGSREAPGDSSTEPTAPTVAELTELGLPVRVRQASLAPQLRDTPPESAVTPAAVDGGFTLPRRGAYAADSAAPAAMRPADPGPASPEAARNIVSALQRGWQLGRSDPGPEPEAAAGESGDEGNAGTEGDAGDE
ncbi:MAG TPA: ATP-binding protein [Streptosporangiaceae bacterium]